MILWIRQSSTWQIADYRGPLPDVFNCPSGTWPDPTRVSPRSLQGAVRWETLGTRLSLEEFGNHQSITSISSQKFNLAFSFQPVSAGYIEKLLIELRINTSCGPDNIPPKILKLSAPTIKEPLTKLINYCITESSWPLDWKRSHITPVYKKDDASSVKNYRPNSILSAVPKLLEKVMYDQL